jgi:hypothetical protein
MFFPLKQVTYDPLRHDKKHESRPPFNQFIDNELEFEVEVMFKSKQLWGYEWEYLVK